MGGSTSVSRNMRGCQGNSVDTKSKSVLCATQSLTAREWFEQHKAYSEGRGKREESSLVRDLDKGQWQELARIGKGRIQARLKRGSLSLRRHEILMEGYGEGWQGLARARIRLN